MASGAERFKYYIIYYCIMSSNRADEKVGVIDSISIIIRRGDGSIEQVDLSPPKITEELLRNLLKEIEGNGMD